MCCGADAVGARDEQFEALFGGDCVERDSLSVKQIAAESNLLWKISAAFSFVFVHFVCFFLIFSLGSTV